MKEFLREQKNFILGSLIFFGLLEIFTLIIWSFCYANQLNAAVRLLREISDSKIEYAKELMSHQKEFVLDESRYVESVLIDEQGNTIISTDESFVKVGENVFDLLEGMENATAQSWNDAKNNIMQLTQVDYAVKNKNGTQTYVLRRLQDGSNRIIITYLSDTYCNLYLRKIYTRMMQAVTGEGIIFLAFCGFFLFLHRNNEKTRKKKDEELKELADRDAMTHLLNKVQTREYINQHIEQNRKEQGLFVIIDIDNFKSVNDRYGHAFGDEVIIAIAQALEKEFERYAYIGRIGGDEFVAFFINLKDEEMILDRVDRIGTLFQDFYVGQYSKHKVTVSMGGACYPEAGDEFSQLYKMADKALYETKKAGKNGFSMYKKEK